jgi:hypothetical protein
MTPTFLNRNSIKAKFFATYALSVILIIILLASFVNPNFSGRESMATAAALSAKDSQAAIDELLHTRMEKLEAAFASFTESGAPKEGMTALQQQESSFLSLVDSIRMSAASNKDGAQRRDIEELLNRFTHEAQNRMRLVKSYASLKQNTASVPSVNTDTRLSELKAMLDLREAEMRELERQNRLAIEERDKTITMLQNRPAVQAAPQQQRADAAVAEWRDRYNKLKASNDKITAEVNDLKLSYKEVVEDNRRLIGQLQSIRAGKS